MAPPQTKTLTVPSKLADVAGVQKAILDDVLACGHSQDTRFAVRLALDEALANAIHHGNQDDPARRVTVTYGVSSQRVQISVCDEGGGFDPSGVPDPRLPENLVKPNGRGIMLMRAYMTDVTFNTDGNCVTLLMRPRRTGQGGSKA